MRQAAVVLHLRQGGVELAAQRIGPTAHRDGIALLVQPTADATHAPLGHGRLGDDAVNNRQIEPLLPQVTHRGIDRLIDKQIAGHSQS